MQRTFLHPAQKFINPPLLREPNHHPIRKKTQTFKAESSIAIVSSLSNCLLIGNSVEQRVYHMSLTEFGALHIVVQYGLRDKGHRTLRWPYYYMRELYLVTHILRQQVPQPLRHAERHLLMCAHAGMNVGVGSEIIVAVPQPCLNVLERVAEVQHDRCTTMSQVVKTNGAQSIFIEDLRKFAGYIVGLDQRA